MCFNLFDFLLRRFMIWALGSFNSVPFEELASPRTLFWRGWGPEPSCGCMCLCLGGGMRKCVSPPFPFTPEASATRGVCSSQNIPLYHGLAFLWPYSLWMKKGKVQVFSPSEPVHWIIHTKRFLLEEEQGGEAGGGGAVPQTGRSRNACPWGLGVALGREFPGVDEVWWQQGVP